MVHILSEKPSLMTIYLNELRHIEIQKDRARFRNNISRIGSFMGYEMSKGMDFTDVEITTPLGTCDSSRLKEQPIIATVLRAGLPLQQGLLEAFDRADSAFISAYRKHHSNEDFEIMVEYASCPDLEGRTLILTDAMLATGQSMVLSYEMLVKQFGTPAKVHFVSVIASAEGVEYLKDHGPENAEIWIGAVDQEMTAQAYIVPGLGDAGDLCYGEKG